MAKGTGLEEYLRQLAKSLDCPRAEKKQILREVRLSLLELPHIHELTLDEIKASENSPEEVARSYLEGRPAYTPRQLRRKRTFRIVVISILVLAVVLLGIFVADSVSYSYGTFVESDAISGVGPAMQENVEFEVY